MKLIHGVADNSMTFIQAVYRIADVAKTCPFEPISKTTAEAVTTSRSEIGNKEKLLYTASRKNCAFLFLSELRQISTNFNKFR